MPSARKPQPTAAPKKSPVRASIAPRTTRFPSGHDGLPGATGPRKGRRQISATDLRQMMIGEFAAWLRTQVNKHKRPYQEGTITAYTDAAKALHAWMTAKRINDDFTACDTAMLNLFFADYLAGHTQGGTSTHQRNLAHLFAWLELTYGVPTPYTNQLNRYAPQKGRPSTLDEQFIKDMLQVTGAGRARRFQDIRDHAIIRVLTEGTRITEVAQIETDDLPIDLFAQPYARVVPLKGARESDEGRIVAFAPSTARALFAYLHDRSAYPYAKSPFLWLGKRGRLTSSGIDQMLGRRADQAGYDPKLIHAHMFRHTFVNDWLADNGSGTSSLPRPATNGAIPHGL